jgi:hypothetical protein
MYAIEVALVGMIYLYTSSFIKIGTGVQPILNTFLRNLRDCIDGITVGMDL